MATRNIEALTAPLYIGNGSDRTVINTDGTIRLEGAATSYIDLIGDLFGAKLLSAAGKVDYSFDENAMIFSSGGSIAQENDRVQWNNEINHEMKLGTGIEFEPHLHWFQSDTTERIFTLEYRLQPNGGAKATSWTTITTTMNATNNVFTYTSGTICQITDFPTITVTCGVSDTLQFRMARTDALSGDVLVYFVDLHGQTDSFGSETEYVKG